MKSLINKTLFGVNNIGSGILALAVVMSIALGCNCSKDLNLANLGKSEPSNSASNTPTNSSSLSETVPSNSVVEGLVKETVEKFSDGVETGDFSELHAYSSANFRNSYTVKQVAEGFKSYTDKKKIVVPILKKTEAKGAEFDGSPSIRREKGFDILSAKGKFATKPYGVRFDFEYVMLGGEWKLLKLVINIP